MKSGIPTTTTPVPVLGSYCGQPNLMYASGDIPCSVLSPTLFSETNMSSKSKFSLDPLVVAHPRFEVDKLNFTILLTAYIDFTILSVILMNVVLSSLPVLDKLFRLKYPTKRCTLLYKLEYIKTK
ncbi:hypothetical protein T12_3681 [Trichinella patagoniensis]|uniref:Uncharacterized protein n=1 Tax=Trichinella patagoniensis TaxID=990121 RepID=A0A0V0ZHK2_9BILA|nr:hypothetical protein T12_3681 [Trichinella patagoniensis]